MQKVVPLWISCAVLGVSQGPSFLEAANFRFAQDHSNCTIAFRVHLLPVITLPSFLPMFSPDIAVAEVFSLKSLLRRELSPRRFLPIYILLYKSSFSAHLLLCHRKFCLLLWWNWLKEGSTRYVVQKFVGTPPNLNEESKKMFPHLDSCPDLGKHILGNLGCKISGFVLQVLHQLARELAILQPAQGSLSSKTQID